MRGKTDKPEGKAGLAVAVLTASFLLFAADAFGKAGRGGTVIVTLKSGVQASGELIHVRPASILILDTSGRDASFDLTELSSIRVVRRSKALQGALLGVLVGAGTGLLAGSAATQGDDFDGSFGTKLIMFYGGGFAGLIVGVIAGGSAGRDLDIQVEGVPPPALRAALQKLSKFARVKGPA
jgi:hypothetical protein